MRISICIPTYNQAIYLEKAIDSCRQQQLQPSEIIVSDDCSTDETPEVLKRLSAQIPSLIVVRQARNLGIARNTDACLRLATGDFVVRLDSDDYLAPEFTKKAAEMLLQYADAGYAHADVQEINQQGEHLRQRQLYRKAGYQTADQALKAAAQGYRVAANIIMFRKKALEKVQYITGRPDYVEDYHLSAALAATGFGNVYVDKKLSYYRVWIDNARVRQRRKMMEIIGLYRVFEEIMQPAFCSRGWSLSTLTKSRTAFACTQSDCLGWGVYTDSEKKELVAALKKLSSSKRVQVFIWLNLKGYARFVKGFHQILSYPKQLAKNTLLSLRG